MTTNGLSLVSSLSFLVSAVCQRLPEAAVASEAKLGYVKEILI